MPFFLEYDTGTEPLWKLVDKVDGYLDLARVTGRSRPVLFSLHSPARAVNLQRRLAEHRTVVPIATTALTSDGRSPAEAVWWLHRHEGALLSLADLSDAVHDTRESAA